MHSHLLVLLNIFSIPDGLLILLAVVLLFGGKKIPELMRGLGQGVSEFNRAKNNLNNEFQEGIKQGMNQPPQSQANTNSTNPAPPANATDQLQKQIEQLQQQLNQLKEEQH